MIGSFVRFREFDSTHWRERTNILGVIPRGVVFKLLTSDIELNKFVLQSRYYVRFWTNTLGKGMSPLWSSAMGFIVPLSFFYKGLQKWSITIWFLVLYFGRPFLGGYVPLQRRKSVYSKLCRLGLHLIVSKLLEYFKPYSGLEISFINSYWKQWYFYKGYYLKQIYLTNR